MNMLRVCCVQRVVHCVMFSTVLSTHFLVTHVCCMCVVYSCRIVHTLSFSETTLSEVFALSVISFISKMLVNCCVYIQHCCLLAVRAKWIPLSLLYHWSCSKVCVQPNWHCTSMVQQRIWQSWCIMQCYSRHLHRLHPWRKKWWYGSTRRKTALLASRAQSVHTIFRMVL